MASYGGPTALTYIPPIVSVRKPIPKGMRFDVLRRDNFTCRYCGAKPPEVVLHVDHVTPVKHGGRNEIPNLVTACLPCNIGKSAKLGTTAPDAEAAADKPSSKNLKRPPIEFFWKTEMEDGYPIKQARVVPWPKDLECWSEYSWLCGDPQFSTHGASTRGFSPYEASMYAVDLLTQRWSKQVCYIMFIDDLILMAEAGHIPQDIGPHILRALHPETIYRRCITRTKNYEDIADSMADQAAAVFKPILDTQHWPYREAGR